MSAMIQTTIPAKRPLNQGAPLEQEQPKIPSCIKPVEVELRETLEPVEIALQLVKAIAPSRRHDPVHCYLMEIARYPLLRLARASGKIMNVYDILSQLHKIIESHAVVVNL
jgi:hypothetical protein